MSVLENDSSELSAGGVGEIPTHYWPDGPPMHPAGALKYKYSRHRTSPRATAKQRRVRLLPWPNSRPKGRRILPPRRPFPFNSILGMFRLLKTFSESPCR
jgi:hypothetical protein